MCECCGKHEPVTIQTIKPKAADKQAQPDQAADKDKD